MKNSSNPKMKDYSFLYIKKWRIEGFEDYYFLTDKRLFNFRTNRFSKKRVKKYSVGYTLDGKFYTLAKMKEMTSLIGFSRFDITNMESVKNLYNSLAKFDLL